MYLRGIICGVTNGVVIDTGVFPGKRLPRWSFPVNKLKLQLNIKVAAQLTPAMMRPAP